MNIHRPKHIPSILMINKYRAKPIPNNATMKPCRPQHIPSRINTEPVELSSKEQKCTIFPKRVLTIPKMLVSHLEKGRKLFGFLPERKKFGFIYGSRNYYQTEQENLTTTTMCGSISRALPRCGDHNNRGSYVDRRQKISSITEDPQVFEDIYY